MQLHPLMNRFFLLVGMQILSGFLFVVNQASGQQVTLVHKQHTIRDNRTQAATEVRGQPKLSYPFSRTALGESFTGTLEVEVPETLTGTATPGPSDGFTILLNPPLKVKAHIKGRYTTTTHNKPEDQSFLQVRIDVSTDLILSRCTKRGPENRLSQGTHDFEFASECTIDRLYIGGLTAGFNTVFDPYTAFDVFTLLGNGGGFGSGPWFSVYSPYEVLAPKDLQVSVVDPNCGSATICDADYLQRNPDTSFQTMRLVQSLGALQSASVTRSAVATDGVTMLLLRASVPETAPADTRITFNLKNAAGATGDAKWGVLMNRDGSGEGSSVTAPTEHVADGRRYAFALYRAPIDHPATTALNTTSITIEAASTAKPDEKVNASIKLVPPPVILVHGVWSNHLAWRNFDKLHLVPAGFRVCSGCRPDYGLTQPAPEFDPTLSESKFVIDAVIHGVDAALLNDRKNGIAVTQVDGIGHSMGGIVLRARVAYQFDSYKKNRNYLKGDFHKIITVGSPHRGSSLVTWLIDHRCDQFSFVARKAEGKETIEREFIKVGKPMGPAIYGFQIASRALANIGRTPVPAHAIIGIAPVTSRTEAFLNQIPEWTNNKNPQGNDLTIDEIAGGEGTHDTIVPTLSQRGGIAIPEAVTEVSGVVHANLGEPKDVDETESLVVWNRIVELLKAPLSGSAFTVFLAYTPDPAVQLRVPAPCPAGKGGGVPAAVATVLPVAGTIVRPGATIVLTLTRSGGNPVEGVLFTAGGRNAIVAGTGPSFTYSYVVPDDRAGRLDIFAGTFGQTEQNDYGESFVIVTPAEAPTSITASPDSVYLKDRGEQIQIVVSGTLPGGTEIDMTSSSAGTTYRTASGGTSVISVTPEGLVEARGTGSDSVIVTQSGKTTSVPVTAQVHVRRRVVRR